MHKELYFGKLLKRVVKRIMEKRVQFITVEKQVHLPQRLMIIEDDPALSEVLGNLFTDLGFYCRIETDAPEMNVIAAFRPDLIIIDYHLPKVNGGEICTALKENEHLSKIPVVIISAYSSILLQLEGSTFDCFIEKPFSIEEILKPVKRLLLKKKPKKLNSNAMLMYFKPWRIKFN
ncbi:DNA-binding response OmpR family regulator [Flavobacterium sp. W4I14]|nr:DNA-binding response OmpR family regulator [Flavobacterium sp. W4I14]